MKRLLILPVLLLTLLVVLGWSGDANAKTTYYDCDGSIYKLDEPLIGGAKFYYMREDGLILMEGAIVDSDYIHWGWEPMEGTARRKGAKVKSYTEPLTEGQKRKTKESASGHINRITGKQHEPTKTVTGKYLSGVCEILSSPPSK